MPKLQERCPQCNKIAKTVGARTYSDIFGCWIYDLECGHVIMESAPTANTTELALYDGKTGKSYERRDAVWEHARPYQRDGVHFLEKSNYKALLADDMGLGKTIQAILAVRYAQTPLKPVLVVVKATLKAQWAREIVKWTTAPDLVESANGINPLKAPFIIQNNQQLIIGGFEWYIVSMDSLRALKDKIKALNCQCVIIDESQAFKDTSSKRTQALLETVATIPHRICLSGTPILNRALEYFPTLNLLDPRTFHTQRRFRDIWVEWDYTRNRYGGIKDYKRDEFQQATAGYILRRLRSQVLTELPEKARYLEIVEIEDPLFKKQYKKQQQELSDFLDHAQSMGALEKYSHILSLLAKLRKLVGMAKVPLCVDVAKDFLESTDRPLTIGIHHRNIGTQLQLALQKYNPLVLTGEQSPEQKDTAIQKFKNGSSRVMIASTLAAGEGLNLQFCADAILMERQWNPAKEEQFEARFHRMGQTRGVNVRYLIAKNSLDEWLSDLIEAKRGWLASAVTNEDSECPHAGMDTETGDIDYFELAEMIVQKPI